MKVKARDESGAESVWSDPLLVSIPVGLPRMILEIFSYPQQILFDWNE